MTTHGRALTNVECAPERVRTFLWITTVAIPSPGSPISGAARMFFGRVRKHAITATAVITSSRTMPIIESPPIVVMRSRIRAKTSERERREDDHIPDCRPLAPRGEPYRVYLADPRRKQALGPREDKYREDALWAQSIQAARCW